MRLVLSGDAPREKWLEARRQGITASEIAVILGLVPGTWNSPHALYLVKRGEIGEDDRATEEMALGAYLEDYVCQRFAGRHPEFALEGNGQDLYASDEHDWMLATPDRLVYEESWDRAIGQWLRTGPVAVLEAKTSGDYEGWGDDGSDEIPVRYRCQVLWQLAVTGLQQAWVACLFLQSRQVRVYRLTVDDDAETDMGLIYGEACRFRQRVLDASPPPVDWTAATERALKKQHPDLLDDAEAQVSATLARRYAAACVAVAKAEQRKKLAENQIRFRIGNASKVTDPGGNVIATRQRYQVAARTIERKAYIVDKLTRKERS